MKVDQNSKRKYIYSFRAMDFKGSLSSSNCASLRCSCFLVTYFYTQKIVGTDLAKKQSIMDQKSFVETYGAYLQIPTCLSFAASVKDEVAISAVLEASRSDPSHRDAMREIEKSNASLFYNSVCTRLSMLNTKILSWASDPNIYEFFSVGLKLKGKLSALLQCLKGVQFELEEERRKILRDMCVSAYPDIQSWQVRDACLSLPKIDSNETREHSSDDTMEALYYSYLSHLLNPVDGHESARQDLNLVKEFCEWSVGVLPRKEKKITCMENFLNVASPSSSLHNSYRRDLMMLLNLSMTIENHDLALDLGKFLIVSYWFAFYWHFPHWFRPYIPFSWRDIGEQKAGIEQRGGP